MRGKTRTEGNDGTRHYVVGTELEDSEHLRQLLVNGLAFPLDDDARRLASSEAGQERYGRPELRAVADELGPELVRITASDVGVISASDLLGGKT